MLGKTQSPINKVRKQTGSYFQGLWLGQAGKPEPAVLNNWAVGKTGFRKLLWAVVGRGLGKRSDWTNKQSRWKVLNVWPITWGSHVDSMLQKDLAGWMQRVHTVGCYGRQGKTHGWKSQEADISSVQEGTFEQLNGMDNFFREWAFRHWTYSTGSCRRTHRRGYRWDPSTSKVPLFFFFIITIEYNLYFF